MSSKVPKDQAVLQKEEGCQEGSLNDAAMSAESGKKFGVRFGLPGVWSKCYSVLIFWEARTFGRSCFEFQ